MLRIDTKNIILLLLPLLLGSCLSGKRGIYLQGNGFKYDSPTSIQTSLKSYQLQPSDVLNIRVIGSDASLSDIFNIQMPQMGGGGGGGQSNNLMNGYIIGPDGKIKVPLIGEIIVAGLTTQEVETQLEEKLQEKYLTNVTVVARLSSNVVSVLGEVSRPGRFPIYQDKVSVLEALAMSGDLDEFANRKNIKLIRQQGEQLEVVLLDITSKRFFESPFYYLKPNDIIYVEPLKAKFGRANLPLLGTIFSGVSTTLLILNFLNNQNR